MNQNPNQKPPAWLMSLIEEHFDELQMLLEMRDGALLDEDYFEGDLVSLDERIECHVDALVLAGDAGLSVLLPGLAADRIPALAAALVLLRQGQKGADVVCETFTTAEGPALGGIREAICLGGLDLVGERLKRIYESGNSLQAAAAAEIFAYHRRFGTTSSRLTDFLNDPDPFVRASAWRIVACVDG